MAASSYDAALRRLLVHEGGYGNHPCDPGGPTNFGITIADYRKYVNPRATAADVKSMRVAEAKAIYRARYWDAMRCDLLPAGLDYALFDYAVNSGTARAARVLQRLLGMADNGRIDDALLAAARRRDARELIVRLCDERLCFLKRLKTWPVFGAGWSRRVAEVKAAALAMAAHSSAVHDASEKTPGKAIVPAAKAARRVTAGGIAAAGAAAAHAAHRAGARLGIIVAIVIVTAALAVCGWFAWRWHRRRRQHAST
jgi:lysozyme family protein